MSGLRHSNSLKPVGVGSAVRGRVNLQCSAIADPHRGRSNLLLTWSWGFTSNLGVFFKRSRPTKSIVGRRRLFTLPYGFQCCYQALAAFAQVEQPVLEHRHRRMLHMPMTISLNDCLATNFVGCQVSIPKAIRIDAHQMIPVQYLPIRLWRMTHNDTFAAHVGTGQGGHQVSPVSHPFGLFKHLNVRIVRCMHKNRVINFVVRE